MDLATGFQIVNAKNVPGTLGCLAHTRHDGQMVLLSAWHVLFGNGACLADPIWHRVSEHRFLEIGRTLYGKIGKVNYAGQSYYMDCAIASYRPPANETHPWRVAGWESAVASSVVTKIGAASGLTQGTIVDMNYTNTVVAGGRKHAAERQLLIRPLHPGQPFATEGDSGALVLDSCNRAVGLLWGTLVNGEALASPIAPILFAMNIELHCPG